MSTALMVRVTLISLGCVSALSGCAVDKMEQGNDFFVSHRSCKQSVTICRVKRLVRSKRMLCPLGGRRG